jgi:hypothetical protein
LVGTPHASRVDGFRFVVTGSPGSHADQERLTAKRLAAEAVLLMLVRSVGVDGISLVNPRSAFCPVSSTTSGITE